MQKNKKKGLRVDKLGNNFKIKNGVFYQLFLESGEFIFEASHIGLRRGTISGAKTNLGGDFKSNEKAYREVPEGIKYVQFISFRKNKAGFRYQGLMWTEKVPDGESVILLIREKKPRLIKLATQLKKREKKKRKSQVIV